MVVGIASIVRDWCWHGHLAKWLHYSSASWLGEGALLRYQYSVDGFIITLVVTLIFGWLASRIPARRAVQVTIREALAYE